MQRFGLFSAVLLMASSLVAQSPRPSITGISHLCVYATDAAAAEHFYTVDLKATKGTDPENAKGTRYYFSPTQFVEVLPLPAGQGISRMDHVAFNTTDAAGLRQYLAAHHAPALSELHQSGGSTWFESKDPEGNTVQFVQPAGGEGAPSAISHRIIHIGYMVHSKAAEDAFFHEVLGFRPYWYGASKPDKVDWVSLQAPNGPDWLEYMLVGDGSTTPLARVDAGELGVLNHFSLGVNNMEQAMTVLTAENRLSPKHNGPQMGLDGKWQANLYDPDGTRVELMEFQPVMKPCCSAFTAESPTQ